MKVEQNGAILNLRAENKDEQRLLDAFWERGVRVCSGGSTLGISLPLHTYLLELDEAQVMALMHLLGSGREQEHNFLAGAMIAKGSILDPEDEMMSLVTQYGSILNAVIQSMKRRRRSVSIGFRGFPLRAKPIPEIEEKSKEADTLAEKVYIETEAKARKIQQEAVKQAGVVYEETMEQALKTREEAEV